jgi:hypothetical protein
VPDLFAAEQALSTGAVFSACRRWRYLLWRTWDRALPHATFCMMNGSTADEVTNDPTVKRCCERAARWADMGFLTVGGVKVVNAFAWRETDSRKLPQLVKAGIDITGPENDAHIIDACKGAAIVVCGWGEPGHKVLNRGPQVLALMRRYGIVPHALKVNASGAPQHPLYIGYDVLPAPLPCPS